MERKKTISERINAHLKEPEGQIFKDGKWRFWFLFLIGLGIINAILAAMIFAGSVGGIALFVGGLVGWVLIGTLYYSDSEDVRLARGVSLLDSITLCFVITHFCFLMWVYGHLLTLQKADAKYDVEMAAYNEKQEKLQAGNVKLGELGLAIAQEGTQQERLKLRTASQLRRAAEAGARIPAARQSSGIQSPALSTAQVELQKPKAPAKSSADFLIEWDAWVRIAYFGELILAAITLIYIRNRSAKFNAQGVSDAIFPVATLSHRERSPKPAMYVHSTQRTTSVATGGREKAAEALRDHLRVISSGLPNRSFKVDLRKPEEGGGVWIRLYESREGKEKMIAKTKQSDKILAAVIHPDFRERLIAELKHQKFPIGGAE